MKLPIKHKFFMQIKEGKKNFEVRDGHITFVDEETKEEIRKDISTAGVGVKSKVLAMAKLTEEDVKEIVTEKNLIYFWWDK